MKNCDINYPCEKEYKRAVHDFQWAAWFCLGFKSTINIHESSSLLSTLQHCDAASRYLTNIPIVLAKLKTYVWEKELLARKEVNGFKPIDNHPNEDEILSGGAPYFGEIDEEKIGRKDVPVCLAFLDEEDDFTRKSESTYLSSTWISINELPVDLGFLDDDEEEDDDVSDVAVDTASLALPTSFGVLRQFFQPSPSHPSRVLTSTGVLGSPIYPDGINTPSLSTASSTLYESSLQVTPMEGKRLLGGLFDDLHDDWLVDDHYGIARDRHYEGE
ncbi:hypothetical protein FRC02_011621 [Tulasnella sp. 418]|nr:hypothetical protein FRC02_011621 [Tulasnella sp. 418]